MTKEPDEVVYSRFMAEKNEDDLRILLERHRDPLMFFLCRIVHNVEDAEELMMDSFAEAVAGRTAFSGRSSFKTWLFAIGRNKARMHLRKYRPETIPLEDASAVDDTLSNNPAQRFITNERSLMLHRAIAKLGTQSQLILHLIYFEEMSYDDVARVLGKTRRQTYRLADKSRAELRKLLENEGYHENDG